MPMRAEMLGHLHRVHLHLRLRCNVIDDVCINLLSVIEHFPGVASA